MLYILHANLRQFRTAWLVESVVSTALIILVVRTPKPFFRSRCSAALMWATLAVMAAAVALPYVPPLARLFDLAALPPLFLAVLAGIVCLYLITAEITKAIFYRHWK